MTIVNTISVYVISAYFPELQSINPAILGICVFFIIYGIITFFTLDKKKGDGQVYARTFILLKGIKLFLALTGVILFVFINKEMALPFIITFVVYYVIYTVFEAIALTKLK
ncbi:MAG: hypothetical protein MJZ34_07605 [Paludibacteraceae bacterium]|nr:hypothetical protein [Paludibacteraceae bacterium]